MDSGDFLLCVKMCGNSVGNVSEVRRAVRCLMNSSDCEFYGLLVIETYQDFYNFCADGWTSSGPGSSSTNTNCQERRAIQRHLKPNDVNHHYWHEIALLFGRKTNTVGQARLTHI